MNLVKWLRKNNKKIMAIVVIVIMIGFVGGSYLQQLSRRSTMRDKTVAYFGEDAEITNYDIALARDELEILKMLRADRMLRNIGTPMFRTQDLQALLLSELLFPDRAISPSIVMRIKQMIRLNEYSISDKQINDIYTGPVGSDLYWLLLQNEARKAGFRLPNEHAGQQYAKIVPQLFDNVTYAQLIGSIVSRQGISEKKLLTTFAKLLEVFEYAKSACSNENATIQQIMHKASQESEAIDVEFVRFESSVFSETQQKPTQEEISEHFDKYKKFFAGITSKENPYGFGYKLADRVQLEYIALKLDDVSTIVTAPTQEEAEIFYQKHREEYLETVPSDPNDPNSPPIRRIKSYAEMADEISILLRKSKINIMAERILQQTKNLTEAPFENIDTEPANLSDEQFRQMAGDYEATADTLSKKHKIKVYSGKTGLLNAADIQADDQLVRLFAIGNGSTKPVGLAQIAFAIDQLQVSELGPFDVKKPRLYENIGPLKDLVAQISAKDTSEQIMVLLRIIKAEKASEPESINQTLDKSTLKLASSADVSDQQVYSIQEKVVEDLKRLSAMAVAKSKAEEFIKQAEKNGWEETISKFNKLYGQQVPEDQDDPNTFKLQNTANLKRVLSAGLEAIAVQGIGDPLGQFLVNENKKEAQLIDRIYSLVPQDANTLETAPLIVEFKPDMSYYCLKNISIKRLSRKEYEKIKTMQAYKENVLQSQSLAAVHYNPENILKRMDFRWISEDEQTPDVNTTTEAGEG